MHAKIHTATSVLCVHFQFSFHRDVEVTRTHEHPKKSCCFWCIFEIKNFSTHKFLSFSLGLLFLKKTKLREKKKKKKKKKRKKKLQISSLAVSHSTHTHTHTKNAQRRRRSKTERRESCALKWPTREQRIIIRTTTKTETNCSTLSVVKKATARVSIATPRTRNGRAKTIACLYASIAPAYTEV